LNWPLIAVGVLVVLAVGLWLFWPSDDDEDANTKKKGSGGSGTSATVPMTPKQQTQPTIVQTASSKTPLSSVVSASAPQANSGPVVRVVPPPAQQQQQQRKTA
jgi:hypothetical protein